MSDEERETAIAPLDERTVERIAAGEVVERPASAVKELVENSLDADASELSVTVEGDGTDLLRVRDDGRGMTEVDVRAAVREHTTSKIDDIDDLERGVGTLGFRGEALHTIGAVSRMAIETKARGATGAGTRLEYEGGEVVSVDPVGCPEGTTVAVRDLFYNTPARRKYLKREATEFAHVSRVVSRYALANPDVAVSLDHDGRETFSTPGRGDLRAAIMSVYGREVAESMVPVVGGDAPSVAEDLNPLDPPAVDASIDPDPEAEGPLVGLTGYVSHPETTRSSTDYVSVFVDGRYVRSTTVREAVLEAYGGQLASERYPFAVLFLSTDPGSVDVNVHPRKTEVRFDDADAVRRDVRAAVRTALLDHGLVRSSAPRGRSAPEETAVSAVSDPDGDGTSSPDDRDDESSSADRRHNPDLESEDTKSGADSPRPDRRSGGRSRPAAAGTGTERDAPDESRSRVSHNSQAGGAADQDAGDADAGTASPDRSPTDDTDQVSLSTALDSSSPRHTASPDPSTADDRFGAVPDQRTLAGEDATPTHDGDRLPSMRVLGQFDETYIVAATDDGLVLVDQHAADERVNYERLRDRLRGSDSSTEAAAQRLATPVELSVTAAEASTVETASEALARIGFDVEVSPTSDDHVVRVTAVPATVDAAGLELLRDVLADVVEGTAPDASVDAAVDDALADLACYPAVTGNTSLTEGRVTALLAALEDCENPYACPHGRPTIVRIDREEIEGRFERDYPGHGG